MKKTIPYMINLSKECIYQSDISELKKVSEIILLTKKEKQLLDLLVKYKNEVVTFETIENEIWPDKNVSATTRRTLIHRLRDKVGTDNIKTIKDFGTLIEL